MEGDKLVVRCLTGTKTGPPGSAPENSVSKNHDGSRWVEEYIFEGDEILVEYGDLFIYKFNPQKLEREKVVKLELHTVVDVHLITHDGNKLCSG